MKSLPTRLMQETISHEHRLGGGSHGPKYAVAVMRSARASWMRQLVRGSSGDEVVSDLTLYVSSDEAEAYAPLDRVSIGTYTTYVISVAPQGRPGQTVLGKVTCQ